jgi:hypothetical protein
MPPKSVDRRRARGLSRRGRSSKLMKICHNQIPNTAYSTSMPESPVLQSGVHPSNRIGKIIKKRQRVKQTDKPQAWAQGGGTIPQDQNHAYNEVQSINQVETKVKSIRQSYCLFGHNIL